MRRSTKYTVTCPNCRLPLTIIDWNRQPSLSYDADEWRGPCKRREEQSPAFCLSEPSIGGDCQHR